MFVSASLSVYAVFVAVVLLGRTELSYLQANVLAIVLSCQEQSVPSQLRAVNEFISSHIYLWVRLEDISLGREQKSEMK